MYYTQILGIACATTLPEDTSSTLMISEVQS
jgi:hypothetical protein